MREILFRGKRVDNGKWVQGYYVYDDSGQLTEKPRADIVRLHEHPCGCSMLPFEVIPESVSEFTGLTDKNGTKIFEGDIVKHYNNSDDGFDIGVLYWDETFSQWKRTSIGNFHHRSFTYVMSRSCEYEVIGNIHDNPELMKGGEE